MSNAKPTYATPKPGFRSQKKPTKGQIERMEKSNAFKKAYLALCEQHGITLDAQIKSFGNYAQVVFVMKPYNPAPTVKAWSESKQENLETRTACEHTAETEEGSDYMVNNCTKCGLAIKDWQEGNHEKALDRAVVISKGTGVTIEYRDKEQKEIAELREKEALQQPMSKDEEEEISDEENDEEAVAAAQKAAERPTPTAV